MTTTELDLTADIIDVRDIIARVEDLEDNIVTFSEDEDDERRAKAWGEANPEDAQELAVLTAILDELEGYGGDEQWRGDWYPVTLIRETYFPTYCEELCDDIGAVPRDFPAYIVIDWEATARNLRVDYSEVAIDGVTYFYR